MRPQAPANEIEIIKEADPKLMQVSRSGRTFIPFILALIPFWSAA